MNLSSTRALWISLFLGGLVARLVLAVTHHEIVYPDEHFQTLEPANWAVTGVGVRSWEWQTGARSWLVPGVYIPILWILELAGVVGGRWPITACRALTAVASLWATYRFWRLLVRRGIGEPGQVTAMSVALFLPSLVVWAPTTLSETWSTVVLWGTMPLVFRLCDEKPKEILWWVVAGASLGVLVAVRYQMVVWVVALLVTVWLLYRPSARHVAATATGLLVAAGAFAVLEWVTWGHPLHSLVTYFQSGLVLEERLARDIVSPWWMFGPLLWRHFGGSVVASSVGLVAAAVIAKRFKLCRFDLVLLLPALSFIVVHSAFVHKQTRFLSPAMLALPFLLAVAVNGLVAGRVSELLVPRSRMVAVAAFLAGVGYVSGTAAQDSRFFFPYDLSEISYVLHREGGLREAPDACVLLFWTKWVWGRGDMAQGHAVRTLRLWSDAPSELQQAMGSCDVAIVFGGQRDAFMDVATDDWELLHRDRRGQLLYRRSELQGPLRPR